MTPRRIIVHGGFHKTGTTSAQQFLFANGDHIWPGAAMVLPAHSRKTVAPHAQHYSRSGAKSDLNRYRRALAELLTSLTLGKRDLLISDENLSGRMPGRDGHPGYHAAPDLMAATHRVLRRFVDNAADIHFVFTTRAPETWLRSTWLHNLRSSRLTMDFDTYADTYAAAADLSATVAAIREAVAPCTVHEVPLENLADNPEGPAAPLIQLLALPEERRARVGGMVVANRGPDPALAPQLLALNRSDLSHDALIREKAALLG